MTQKAPRIYEFGEWHVCCASRSLLKRGKPVPVESRAFDMLVVLVENHGNLVTKDDLISKVWLGASVEEGNITHHMYQLRKALRDTGRQGRYIRTVSGRGYQFVATVTQIADGQVDVGAAGARQEHAGSVRSQGRPLSSSVQPVQGAPNNLRLRATPLIGREAEIQTAISRIRRDDMRLLSLVGGPGVGKTCLAIEAARVLMPEFPDGVFLVELAPIRDPELAASAIASTLGLKESGGTPITETLRQYLSGKRLLLVLDNFEHVLPATLLIAELLATAPGFKVLATSREPLGLSWEHLYEVPALAIPHSRVDAGSPVLQQNPAVALLLQTACRVKSDFAISPANAPAVAQICRRLQGVPLAIELVAAHVNDMSPEEMLARPDGGMALLARGPRDAPPRHETMGRAIDWSYDLLDEDEKRFFSRLSVFIGGFTLEAGEFVCRPQESSGASILDRLMSLKNKSLVVRRDSAGQSRFIMLEVIREYAVERLAAGGEDEALKRRHAAFFCNMAERSGTRLEGETLPATLDALEAEIGNLRAALQWSVDSGDAETGLRIAGPVRHFWYMRDHTSEARKWLESLLSIDSEVSPLVKAKALGAGCVLAQFQGDFEPAAASVDEALNLVRETGDREGTAELLRLRADLLVRQKHFEEALPLLEESLAICREIGASWHVAGALNDLGCVALHTSKYEKAIDLCKRSLFSFEELKDNRGAAMAANNVAASLVKMGRFEETSAYLKRSLILEQEIGHTTWIVTCFHNFADLACRRQQFQRTALLLSLVDAWQAETNSPRHPYDVADYETALAAARSALGPEDFKAAWDKGRAMTVEEGVAYVLKEMC
jgi:predicted ATPase/DNA-binding winged helix-turn-helix (wHTH) protein